MRRRTARDRAALRLVEPQDRYDFEDPPTFAELVKEKDPTAVGLKVARGRKLRHDGLEVSSSLLQFVLKFASIYLEVCFDLSSSLLRFILKFPSCLALPCCALTCFVVSLACRHGDLSHTWDGPGLHQHQITVHIQCAGTESFRTQGSLQAETRPHAVQAA